MIVYDNRFNANEWFVITAVLVGLAVVALLPKRFPRKASLVFYMCGVYSGFFFDHSLSVEPKSFYDVNDTSMFQVMDFISYWMYGPVSYLFFYVLDVLRLPIRFLPLYVFAWTLADLVLETFATHAGVFHYRHGYGIAFSMPVYLLTHSAWLVLYFAYRRIASSASSL